MYSAHFAWQHIWLAIMVGLAIGVLHDTARASPLPLTLEQAQHLAIERSRQLLANDAAIQGSRAMAVSAAQNPDPVLQLGIDNLPVDGPDRFSLSRDFMTQQRIGVMQEFTRAEKRRLRSERYEYEAGKALAEKSATVADILLGTALAWFDRYYAEAMAGQMAEAIQQAQLEIDVADSAYRSGRGSQADVFAARAARVVLEDRASELDRRVRLARIALMRWIGDREEGPLATRPLTDEVPFQSNAIGDHMAQHPKIDLLTKEKALASVEAKLAQANKTSDWSVEVAYSQRGQEYSNMVSVGVSIPLQWDQKNRQDQEINAKLARVEQVQAVREETLRALNTEVHGMLVEWNNSRERQARIEHELLPLATGRTLAALSAYRGGKSSLSEVLSARRNEIEVRLQSLQLEFEVARLWAQLKFLLPVTSSNEVPQ